MLSLGLIAALACQASAGQLRAEPPLLPSGMDLLYGDHVAFLPSGEPMVTIGLTSGKKSFTVRSKAPLQIDFYEAGVLKRSTIAANTPITIGVRRAQPAKGQTYLELEALPWGAAAEIESALARWRARGYAEVEPLEEGTVLGLGGRVLDNRQLRVVLPLPSAKFARATATELFELFGERAPVRRRLIERPWGELDVKSRNGPLGLATSYVRVSNAGRGETPITVAQVEFGKGYGWHGREDRSYRGEIYVVINPKGTLAAVNVVGAETVLKGVVPSELFASAPAEALKAQAVAARTHLIAKLGRRHHGDPFHLCGSQHCQVFTGTKREDPRTSAAVKTTTGLALFHTDELVHVVYSSTCGGHTEDNEAVWGNLPHPALRGRPDFEPLDPAFVRFENGLGPTNITAWVEHTPRTYCSMASSANMRKFRWKRRFTVAEAQQLVEKRYPNIGQLIGISVRKRARGGKVVSLRITGSKNKVTVLLELPIRRLFDNLNSGTFVVDQERDGEGALTAIDFTGAGWGHGVGMCQLGAVGRAEAGHDYGRILAHYFNGAMLSRLYGAQGDAEKGETAIGAGSASPRAALADGSR